MNNSEKSQFIAENIAKIVNKHYAKYQKIDKSLEKSYEEINDPVFKAKLMADVVFGAYNSINGWEERSYPELDDMTPKQFFESLTTAKDIIELVYQVEKKNKGYLPYGLIERIENLNYALSDDMLKLLEVMKIGEDKCLSPEQHAIVHIAELVAIPEFLSALVGIISQFDDEKSDDDSFEIITDAIVEMGEPAVEKLISMVEINEKGRKLEYLLITIAEISTKNKSERIYSFLKNYFRKSETKIAEAQALSLYGDGRAIPAIRGYVEKNKGELTFWEYSQFRDFILTLGGNTSDLDKYFYEKDYNDEFGEFDEFDENDEYEDNEFSGDYERA